MKKSTLFLLYICLLLIFVSCNNITNAKQYIIKTETTHPDVTIIDAKLSKSLDGFIIKARWANNAASQIICGKKFDLEIKNGKTWESVTEIDGTMFTLEQIVIYPNHLLKEDNETAPFRLYNDSSFELIVSEHYYIKSDCEYRISIDFQLTPVEETYKAYLFFST